MKEVDLEKYKEVKPLKKGDVIKIGPNQYKMKAFPNVIVNTSLAVKSLEENKPILKAVGDVIIMSLMKEECRKRGIRYEDLL